MQAKFDAIFNVSVVGGIIGLAFTDALLQGSNSWIGFGLGLFIAFTLLSGTAVITETVQSQQETETKLLVQTLAQLIAGTSVTTEVQNTTQQMQRTSVTTEVQDTAQQLRGTSKNQTPITPAQNVQLKLELIKLLTQALTKSIEETSMTTDIQQIQDIDINLK